MGEFDPSPEALLLWRAVEAQHVVATMALVDTLEEQAQLERLIEESKPPLPAGATGLHYLLFTPFRYPPPGSGSRFRRPGDPGVFYGAEAVRTACAEVGYWRWRFLRDSPGLERIDPKPQTVFRAAVASPAIDLRKPPYLRRRRQWTDPNDYQACQALAARVDAAGPLGEHDATSSPSVVRSRRGVAPRCRPMGRFRGRRPLPDAVR
mgnify:CR=1 FL=1